MQWTVATTHGMVGRREGRTRLVPQVAAIIMNRNREKLEWNWVYRGSACVVCDELNDGDDDKDSPCP